MTVAVPAAIREILLDIEGTTSSIRFVTETMFPFVRKHIANFLESNWERLELVQSLEKLAQDAGQLNATMWLGSFCDDVNRRRFVTQSVFELMDRDSKSTGLKDLQGLIWRRGFESGELVAHVYDDVTPAIRKWVSNGRKVRIYSSGSIAAQKLFFGHSAAGNLLPLISGHFDTTVGNKREQMSYQKISSEIGISPQKILFVSDVTDELRAARSAGFHVLLSVRAENDSQPGAEEFDQIRSLLEIEFC